MATPAPPSIVEAFATNGERNPIPIPSQINVSPELASFNDGFPAATRIPRTQGGIPPRGLDMNGILWMISAHTAWVAAGGGYVWNADVVAVAGGYPIGAVIRSATNPQVSFYNTLDGNPNDPDNTASPGNGWLSFSSLGSGANGVATPVLTPGTHNDVAVAAGVAYVDVDTTAGNVDITGFAAASDGQSFVLSNIGTGLLQVLALNAGSAAGNRVRIPSDLALVQNQSVTLRKSSTIGKWVIV
jgi:hypothetical protein